MMNILGLLLSFLLTGSVLDMSGVSVKEYPFVVVMGMVYLVALHAYCLGFLRGKEQHEDSH